MKNNRLPLILVAICSIFVFLCFSCKQDRYINSVQITPQAFPSPATTGRQFRKRTKGVKIPIPVDSPIEEDTTIISNGIDNLSGFTDFKVY
jgi:hypothetical protein